MEVRVHIGGCAPILLATCTRFCPSPSLTGSPARHPGLVPGPLALAPGPAAVGFLFLPVSLELTPASPPPSSCLAPSSRCTYCYSLIWVFIWQRKESFPDGGRLRGGAGHKLQGRSQSPHLGILTSGNSLSPVPRVCLPRLGLQARVIPWLQADPAVALYPGAASERGVPGRHRLAGGLRGVCHQGP